MYGISYAGLNRASFSSSYTYHRSFLRSISYRGDFIMTDSCCICWGPCDTVTSCGHNYCKPCLWKWSHQSDTCACCRKPYSSSDRLPLSTAIKPRVRFFVTGLAFFWLISWIFDQDPTICYTQPFEQCVTQFSMFLSAILLYLLRYHIICRVTYCLAFVFVVSRFLVYKVLGR